MFKIGVKIICTLLISFAAYTLRAQTFTSVSFDGTDGKLPYHNALVQGRDGALYGMTFNGGAYGAGAVIRVKGASIQAIYSFCAQSNCADGGFPFYNNLVLGNDGEFYGTTNQGGVNNSGTVFKITPKGVLTTLYTFCTQPNCADGAFPAAGLVHGIDGNFYGTTGASSPGSGGTVFKITPQGKLTTLYTFCSQLNCTDGAGPLGELTQGADGQFYGTTYGGGNRDGGTIFKISPKGHLTTLYSFCSENVCDDGEWPESGLLQSSDGNFYGTTWYGGLHSEGTLYRMTPSGEFTSLYSFCDDQIGCSDGANPAARPIEATDGKLYGLTSMGSQQGCSHQCGTIFSYNSDKLKTLFTFCAQDGRQGRDGFPCPTGAGPFGALLQATDGNFYGMAEYGGEFGGAFGYGLVFRLSVGLRPFVSLVQAGGKVGSTGGILGQDLTGTTNVTVNGVPAAFEVISDTYIRATVPEGATSGYVTVTTPNGTLTSNKPFIVLP